MAEDLKAISDEITAIADKIRSLKAESEVAPNAIGECVAKLNEKKALYAKINSGIGVDGKPFEAPMSKVEKRKKAKEAAEAAGPAKQEGDPQSAGSLKKAAKKAEAKAKKDAMKLATASGTPAAAGSGGAPAAAVATAGAKAKVVASNKGGSMPPARTPMAESFQILVNPNQPLKDRPVVALAAGVFSNTMLDYEIKSDHRCRQATMGLPDGGAIVGDFAIARYIARRAPKSGLLPESPSALAIVDAWTDYAQSLSLLEEQQRVTAVAMTLTKALQQQTYVAGSGLTLADIALFAVLGFPTEAEAQAAIKQYLPAEATVARRWIEMMTTSPTIRKATQLAIGVSNNNEAVFDEGAVLDPLVPGMNLLEGGIIGNVTTRFPPEPSGYLHIGHAKAVLLNDYYARRYKGRLIVRFDDTNPSKEKEEYEQSIVEDLGKLGVVPALVTYSSDYFSVIYNYAIFMIDNGLAFMDDTPQEEMKIERGERKESKRRSLSPQEAKDYFLKMCSGSEAGSGWCLRGKIDMSSDNGTMRDPVLFRQNTTPHHRTGTAFKAYPTYDLTCPIVDSIEGVSHALRTTEYNDRDEQYQWIQRNLSLRRVIIHSFARMNFNNTVLSKRKLTILVDKKYVTGWDDARFPTVRGVLRRGINITALRGFMYSQGASRRVVNLVWNTFWAENKKEIDKKAKRFMAIDSEPSKHALLRITAGANKKDNAFISTQVHPKDPSLGTRLIRISNEVLLEAVDIEGIEVGEDIVLLRYGVVRIKKVDGGLEGNFVPQGDFRAAKRKVSWVAKVANTTPLILTEFDNLLSKDKLDEGDNMEDFINPNTLASTHAVGDAGLKSLMKDDIIQLERRGFYRVDRPYIGPDKPLSLFMVPDGKTKAMSGLAGKLAHR